MTDAYELLAAYWLKSNHTPETDTLRALSEFSQTHNLNTSDEDIAEVARLIDDDDPGMYVVFLNFMGHPYLSWNLIIDAVKHAETEDHLMTIAAGPAEHLLAHYGSLVVLFEQHARRDPKFARMLTGVWRHRMSDRVWARLRLIQQAVPNPLPSVIAPDEVTNVSEKDRNTDDKGPFYLTPDGAWEKRK